MTAAATGAIHAILVEQTTMAATLATTYADHVAATMNAAAPTTVAAIIAQSINGVYGLRWVLHLTKLLQVIKYEKRDGRPSLFS